MRIGKVGALIRAYEAAGIAPYLEGAPGCGKSRLVWYLCDLDAIACIDVRLALLNPVDLRGIPVVKGGHVVWVPPVFLKENACRFFLDELPNAPPATQSAAYQWILDHGIGEWRMNREWTTTKTGHKRPFQTIIAAGNRATDQAFVHQMAAPLRNRLGKIELETNFEDWREWAYKNDIDRTVINFLAFTARINLGIGSDASGAGLLFWFDKRTHANSQFPTPRSWEFVSRFLRANPSMRKFTEAYTGLVGEAVAQKFAAFIAVEDKLPNADEIVRQGKIQISPPDARREPSATFAFCGALAAALIRVEDPDERLKATRHAAAYCTKWWGTDDQEFAILTMKDFARTEEYKAIYRKVVVTPEWVAFTKTFHDLMGEA